MSKIVLQGFIIVPESDIEVVKNELLTHKKLTLSETGCLIFEVTLDAVNPNRFNVYEEFVNQEAFNYHQLRVKSSTWGKVTKDVERHYQISAGT